MENNEIWKTIEEFPDYQISSFGRVKSNARTIKFFIRRDEFGYLTSNKNYKVETRIINKKEKLLKLYFRNDNYKKVTKVTLRKNNKTYVKTVARLVLITFRGFPLKDQEACHNDGNYKNNHIHNLRWDTHKNNMNDMYLHGTIPTPPRMKGEGHPASKLKNIDIKSIRTKYPQCSLSQLANEFNVAKSTIHRIVSNKGWNIL